MPKIEIYSSENCSYCLRAKQLLDQKSIPYTEIRVDQDDSRREEMLNRTNGARTVPQIFISGRLVGGFDDLQALDQSGRLDQLLSEN